MERREGGKKKRLYIKKRGKEGRNLGLTERGNRGEVVKIENEGRKKNDRKSVIKRRWDKEGRIEGDSKERKLKERERKKTRRKERK